MSLEQFQALKKFLESTDEFDDRQEAAPLLELFTNLVEAENNNSNLEEKAPDSPSCYGD
jgi:hypothetical protein